MNDRKRRAGRVYCGSLIGIVALTGLGLWVLRAPGGPPANDSVKLGGRVVQHEIDALEIGPIQGLTTAWHLAPQGTAIPVGVNLLFRTKAAPAATVTWTGAIEISRNDRWSTAICLLPSPGEEVVRAVVSSPNESYADECRLDVVDIPLEQITVSPISVGTDPMEIDETLPQDQLNEVTMGYFFGPSIAAIRPVGEGLYRTSINRRIPLHVDVDPPGFAPLIEWRVDGNAAKLGASVEQALDEIGLHTISAGPLAAEQTVDVDTYEVIITSHVSGEDIIPEGEPVVFTAVTNPPGYENDITWLSSTKYGSASPVLGEGPVFVAQFSDTWGPFPGGGQWRWLGVKADNVAFGQDQKCIVVDFSTPLTTSFNGTYEVIPLPGVGPQAESLDSTSGFITLVVLEDGTIIDDGLDIRPFDNPRDLRLLSVDGDITPLLQASAENEQQHGIRQQFYFKGWKLLWLQLDLCVQSERFWNNWAATTDCEIPGAGEVLQIHAELPPLPGGSALQFETLMVSPQLIPSELEIGQTEDDHLELIAQQDLPEQLFVFDTVLCNDTTYGQQVCSALLEQGGALFVAIQVDELGNYNGLATVLDLP